MSDDEKPTPPVPPMDEIIHPEKEHGSCVLEREAVDTCDCGGTIYDEEIATGRVILAIWEATDFDPDDYQLSVEYDETERRVECSHCSAGWTY